MIELWQVKFDKCLSVFQRWNFFSLCVRYSINYSSQWVLIVLSTTWLCLIVETLHGHTDYEYVAIAVKFDDIASTSYTQTPEVVIIFNYDRFYGLWRLITLRTYFQTIFFLAENIDVFLSVWDLYKCHYHSCSNS